MSLGLPSWKRYGIHCLDLLGIAACCTRLAPAPAKNPACSKPPPSCRDNQAARGCIARAEAAAPEAKRDPYLRLTHANVVMAMLPTGRFSTLKAPDKAKHHEFISKVGPHTVHPDVSFFQFCVPISGMPLSDCLHVHPLHPFHSVTCMSRYRRGVPSSTPRYRCCTCVTCMFCTSACAVSFAHQHSRASARTIIIAVPSPPFAQALHLYKEVIRSQPDNIYALNGVGTCLAGEHTQQQGCLCGSLHRQHPAPATPKQGSVPASTGSLLCA